MKDVIQRLEKSIDSAAGECETCETQELLSAAGQALGLLKALNSFDIKRAYDQLVYLAAYSGQCPPDITRNLENENSIDNL